MNDEFEKSAIELQRWTSENMCQGKYENMDPERAKLEAGSNGLREFQKRVYAVILAVMKDIKKPNHQGNG